MKWITVLFVCSKLQKYSHEFFLFVLSGNQFNKIIQFHESNKMYFFLKRKSYDFSLIGRYFKIPLQVSRTTKASTEYATERDTVSFKTNVQRISAQEFGIIQPYCRNENKTGVESNISSIGFNSSKRYEVLRAYKQTHTHTHTDTYKLNTNTCRQKLSSECTVHTEIVWTETKRTHLPMTIQHRVENEIYIENSMNRFHYEDLQQYLFC